MTRAPAGEGGDGTARLARITARVACRAWRVPDAGDSAVLVASELLNLGLRAPAQDRLTLRVLMTPRRLRLEIRGASARPPLPGEVGAPVEAGATADLLSALCVRWGVAEDPTAAGPDVWAEIALVDGRAP